MEHTLICKQCGVNQVDDGSKDREICGECLEDEALYEGNNLPLDFNKADYRRDDRMRIDPPDVWGEGEDWDE